MTLRTFSFLCLAMSVLGIVPVLLKPGMKDSVTLIMFGIVMLFMAMGFRFVSRALSQVSGSSGYK